MYFSRVVNIVLRAMRSLSVLCTHKPYVYYRIYLKQEYILLFYSNMLLNINELEGSKDLIALSPT